MKNLKWIIPLAVVVVLLMVALPAAADDPFGGPPSKLSGNGQSTWGAIYIGGTWDNVRGASIKRDPSTGCFPNGGQVPGGYTPMTWNPIPEALATNQRPQPGILTQLNQPGQPKTMNNDSSAVTASGVALVPGVTNQTGQEFQVAAKVAQPCGPNDSLTGVVDSVEYDRYITNWSDVQLIPAGSFRWFKFDTVKSRDVELYLDDVPKWGAAYRYFGTQSCVFHQAPGQENGPAAFPGTTSGIHSGYGDCDKADNLQRIGIDTSEIAMVAGSMNAQDTMFLNGISARWYPPEWIRQNDYFWPTPNNGLLTTRDGSRPRVADTQGSYGGYGRGGASLFTSLVRGGQTGFSTYFYLEPADQIKWGDGNTHLLASKLHVDGWVYVRASNGMIWDQNVRLGTRFTPNQSYDFPCDNCPYPFDPNH